MKKSWLLLTLPLLFSSFAQAMPGEGSVEIGPFVGYRFPYKYSANNPKNSLLYGARVGYFLTSTVSFEPSFQLSYTDTKRAAGANNGVTFTSVRFNLLYNFLPEQRVRPYLIGGLGWEKTNIKSTLTSSDLGVNLGLGLRVFLNDWIALRVEGIFDYLELGSAADSRQYNYEGNLGLSFFFGGKPPTDTDADGVADKKDECANTPAGATVDEKGCPADADSDGVFDGLDKCVGTPSGVKVDPSGCPVDSDADGVSDGPDQCANTPAGATVDEKGCPTDSDGDGVIDVEDKCPETPKGTPVDSQGCPANVDADGDGVTDAADLCPETPKGTTIDDRGCPMKVKSRGVLKGVNFKFGKAVLTPESSKVLDQVANELLEFPKVRVEVQGHTDNVGPKEANLKISQARAESVKKYLVTKGIEETRLEAKGYGDTAPLAPNKTKIARAKNRRVELKWIDSQ